MYYLNFGKGIEFAGGEPNNSRWNQIPNNPIVELEYNILGKSITLRDFASYNHIVERAQIINKKSADTITAVYLMGKYESHVYVIKFDLIKNTVRDYISELEHEYNGGTTTGWKQGLSTKEPTIDIKQL
jgi:hypothetical protein